MGSGGLISGRELLIHMKKNSAQSKALKITVPYFLIGCAWILFSDRLVQVSFTEQSQVFYYSIVKGILYVLITSFLIYGLTYPTLKEALDGREALKKANMELKESNEQYKKLYQEYSKKQALLKSLIDSIPDLVFYKDTNSVYMGCNAAFAKFAGKQEQDIIGLTDRNLFITQEAELFSRMDAEMLCRNVPRKNEETIHNAEGKEVIYETLKTPYHDQKGNIIGLIGISRDITERKNREERVRYISYHDAMTGIYNRAYYDEARTLIDTQEKLPVSVIVGDVNGMRLINDAFGHIKGDALLRKIAAILIKCARQEDIVARTGGDEFSILMPHADANMVKMTADRIRAMCKEERDEENNEIFLDIALGYATKTKAEDSLDKAIILAGDLMYRRKLLEQKSPHNDYLAYIKTTMLEKSNETEEHEERLVKLSKKLGEKMGLSEDEQDELELVAMLHDIGKISVDKKILTKTEKLTEEEWGEIKKHPEVGYRIANATSGLSHIAEYILCHHEHWDGTGYRLGLSGTDIPLLSRIITIVDSYDAMTQDRAYRKALSREVAIKEILDHKGTQFDPVIADLFVDQVLQKEDENTQIDI